MLETFTAFVRRGRRRYVVTATRRGDRHAVTVANADGTHSARFLIPAAHGRRGSRFSSGLAELAVDQFRAWLKLEPVKLRRIAPTVETSPAALRS